MMSVKRRLILHFVLQLVAILGIFLFLVYFTLQYMTIKLNELEMNRDFASAGLSLLLESMELHNGEPSFDPKLLEMIQKEGGWLQVIGDDGTVTQSYFTPEDVPKSYGPAELTAYWMKKEPFPYDLSLWVNQKYGNMYTLLYGKLRNEDPLLPILIEKARIDGKQIIIPNEQLQLLKENGGWIQVIDYAGTEIASLQKPADFPTHYTLQELVSRAIYSGYFGIKLSYLYDPISKETWLLHLPMDDYSQTSLVANANPELNIVLTGIISLVALLLLILLGVAFWYGHRFGTPMLYIMNWLQSLANGNFAEPLISSKTKSGRLKRKYRIYKDVLQSLDDLTDSLKLNKEMRAQMDQMRDEWVANLSHDLKTPLSSIQGYAQMLESPQYEWSREEIREFATIISEKAIHLDYLMNDLNLTYRLKSGKLDLELEPYEMNQFVEQAVKPFLSDPKYENRMITCSGTSTPIVYPIDYKWFMRILDNLLANAINHNPPETKVEVRLMSAHNGGFSINVIDHGIGMDLETKNNLFERYYRGTNTESNSTGTGLGMAIAKQLVLAHGGQIVVESELGKGTTIRLIFMPKP